MMQSDRAHFSNPARTACGTVLAAAGSQAAGAGYALGIAGRRGDSSGGQAGEALRGGLGKAGRGRVRRLDSSDGLLADDTCTVHSAV